MAAATYVWSLSSSGSLEDVGNWQLEPTGTPSYKLPGSLDAAMISGVGTISGAATVNYLATTGDLSLAGQVAAQTISVGASPSNDLLVVGTGDGGTLSATTSLMLDGSLEIGDQFATIEVGAGGSLEPGLVTVDSDGSISGVGDLNSYGQITNNGTITATGGELAVGFVEGTGVLAITSSGTLSMSSPFASSAEVSFVGTGGSLVLGNLYAAPTGEIENFRSGDTVEVDNYAFIDDDGNVATPTLVYQPSGAQAGTLEIIANGAGQADLNFIGDYSTSSFSVAVDTTTGSLFVTDAQTYKPPVATLPAALLITEGSTSVLSGVTVLDPYAETTGGTISVELTAQHGTFIDAEASSGSGSGTITLSGAVDAVNTALSTLAYTAGSSSGGDSVNVTVGDQAGATDGLGGLVAVTITPIYTTPDAILPATVAVTAGDTQVLQGLSVSDPYAEATSGIVSVEITSVQGSFSDVDGSPGSNTDDITIAGSVSAVNADLASLTYTAGLMVGTTSISVQVGDQEGAADGFDGQFKVINDPAYILPTITMPAEGSVTEGSSVALTDLSVSDAYANAVSSPITVYLTVDQGLLSDDDSTAGSGAASLTLTGSVAEVNAALATLTYTATSTTGTATITATLGDDFSASHINGGETKVVVADEQSAPATTGSIITPTSGGNASTISFTSGNNVIQVDDGNHLIAAGLGDNTITLGSGSDYVISSGQDVISLSSGSDTVAAVRGTQNIIGSSGSLLFFVGASEASINTGSGQSLVFGGAQGSSVAVYGSTGSDTLVAGAGQMSLIGGLESDTVYAGAGGGTFYAGSGGNSVLVASSGNTTLVGGASGDDLFAAETGGDVLVAGKGAESLIGNYSSGSDLFFAGSGDTTIYCGGGSDTVFGGTGSAAVLVGAGALSYTGGTGTSDILLDSGVSHGQITLNDFRPDVDKLQLFGYSQASLESAFTDKTVTGDSSFVSLSDGTRIEFAGLQNLTGVR